MYTVQPSPSRRALRLFATIRVCSISVRPYFVFTAPESVPPWLGSRTTFPEQGGCSCACSCGEGGCREKDRGEDCCQHRRPRPEETRVCHFLSFRIGFISRRRGGTRSRGSSWR